MVLGWLPLLVQGIWVTLAVAACAALLGGAGGLTIGMLTARRMRIPVISRLLDGYVLLIRGTPLFVQLLILYYVLPDLTGINISPAVAGITALGINESAYCAEIIRGGIDALPAGQWEAAAVLGYSRTTTMKDIVIPQVLRITLPSLANEVATIIKDTSIVSVIGLMEITHIGKNIVAQTLKPLEIYALVAAIYLVITTGVALVSSFLTRKLHHD